MVKSSLPQERKAGLTLENLILFTIWSDLKGRKKTHIISVDVEILD